MSVHAKKSLVIDALKRALVTTAEQAFLESQKRVPVVTGRLRSSGNIIRMDNGVLIQYLEKYASFVERGWKGGRISISSYTRKDGVQVKSHYANMPPRNGKHFIEDSMKKFFKGETGQKSFFQEEFKRNLKSNFWWMKSE